MGMIKSIRSAARALIVHDGKLLATKMRDRSGPWYTLPGGGQLPGETLKEALERECREEIGCAVQVGELLYVREYIGKNHHFAHRHAGFHQVEHVFRAFLKDPNSPCLGDAADTRQIGVNWLALEALEHIRFYPEVIKPYFDLEDIRLPALYLGDCN